MNAIFDFLILLCLVIYYRKVNRAMNAAIECEKHLALLSYQATKRDRKEVGDA